MRAVRLEPAELTRFAEILPSGRYERLEQQAVQARALLQGRTVWNLSSTAEGGGVAEMLQTLVSYGMGVGVDIRWLVIEGDPTFFAITKRVHNLLHGSPGDGGGLGPEEREHYLAVQAENLAALAGQVRSGDIVLVHDPQPAGMVAGLRERGAHVIWRCHVGADVVNEHTDRAWGFLREFVEAADSLVFSRRAYAPDWIPPERVRVIPPSIDPFRTKNTWLDPDDVRAVLEHAGLVGAAPDGAGVRGGLGFVRRDGSVGWTRAHVGLVLDGEPPPYDARIVLQVSRWDHLKDMAGVLTSFAENLSLWNDDVHLMLVGPDSGGVSDDPESAEVLGECRALWRALPGAARQRIHLVTLPMDDPDENAHLVNALQRQAAVVVQKSLMEGFGLTVTEPMWKARPVVASAVGGIVDQVEDGVSGLLLPDPHDLATFAELVAGLLADPEKAGRLGDGARERVRDRFLGDRHLIQWVELFATLLAPEAS